MKTVTIYIDILLFVNLIVNGTIIFAAARMTGTKMTFGRFAAADAAASVYGFCVCLPPFGFMIGMTAKTVFSLLVSAAAFGIGSWRKLLKNACVFMFWSLSYLAVIIGLSDIPVFGGIFYVKNSEVYFDLPVQTVLTGGLVLLAIAVVSRKIAEKKTIMRQKYDCDVTLGGKTVSFSLLHDSGNLLRDCITGEPVAVIGKRTAQKLTAGGIPKTRLRIIPYQSADGKNGILTAFKPDKTVIDGSEACILIAVSDADFGEYDGVIGTI